MYNMRQQSINSGARIETKTVDKVDLSSSPFKVYVGGEIFEAKSLIIATGATAKRM
jgi:thioredoxin reductase (NADPH)